MEGETEMERVAEQEPTRPGWLAYALFFAALVGLAIFAFNN